MARLTSRLRFGAAFWGVGLLLLGSAIPAQGGGGPENVVLVVNSASWASQTVANHFVRLRHIAPRNVVYLPWEHGIETISADDVRAKILGPVIEATHARGLDGQIDYVVYSSDFPCAVDLTADTKDHRLPPQLDPVGSMTGVTYLSQHLMIKDPAIVDLRANGYMRRGQNRRVDEPTHGFRSWYGWGRDGRLLEAGGQRYLLSAMLAVTSGRGNSVSEAVDYLTSAAAADGTNPRGTIYFMQGSDVRSTARKWGCAAAAGDLEQLGVKAQVLGGELPFRCQDVQGLLIGTRAFSWPGAQSKILPGAYCDNLTSYGGAMEERSDQTPFSEFLRHGAAGASGTVVEPYLIQDKFAVPDVFVHYARGCTLAEAFYQSVWGPYQILLVGDPLCRPWADIPEVAVAGLSPNQKISGRISITPQATAADGQRVDRFELFVDGVRMARATGDESRELETERLADGYHELRVVAIEPGPIESQGRAIIPFSVDNHGRSIVASTAKKSVRWGQPCTLSASAAGAARIVFLHNGRTVAKIDGDKGDTTVDTRMLGCGPITIMPVAIAGAGGRDVAAAPIEISVEPAEPLPALAKIPSNRLKSGLRLKSGADVNVPITETRDPSWLASAGVKPGKQFELDGYFETPSAETRQFEVAHSGKLKLEVDGVLLYEGHGDAPTFRYLPISLAAGMHRLTVIGEQCDASPLRIFYGGPGALSLNGATFRHLAD